MRLFAVAAALVLAATLMPVDAHAAGAVLAAAPSLSSSAIGVAASMMPLLPGLPRPRSLLGVSIRADASPTALIGQLQNAFEEFKKSHAEELEKGDVVARERTDRIDATISQLQAAVDRHALALQAQQARGGRHVEDGEYSKAFAAHMRKGDIQASLNKGTAAEGGYFTPIEWDRTIVDRLVTVSPMRQIASVQQIGTSGFSRLYNSRGTGSGWVGETATRPETTTPTIGSLNFDTGEIYANPGATQGFLDDGQVDVETWLAAEVETEFAYQEGIAFVSGNGTNKPFGFLTYATGAANASKHPWGAVLVGKLAAAVGAVTGDELIDLVMALPQEYHDNARFVMNRSTLATIRKMKDGNDAYIWQPSLSEAQPQALLGYPVTEMAAMPNMAANALPIAFGDFRRGYQIVDRFGTRVLRDPYTNKPYVMFYTTRRVGGGVQNPDTIKVLKMAAS
jgi:HK97 family phage major capsid protein